MISATFAAEQYFKRGNAIKRRHPICMKIAAFPHGTEPDVTRRLHAEAQKCKRLASEVLDVVVRDALIELASQLEQEAERAWRSKMRQERGLCDLGAGRGRGRCR